MTLHVGDCLQVLPTLADASVDAVVTDPPYGLEFMGKEWDAPWQARQGVGGHSAGFSIKRYKDGSTAPIPNYTGGTNPTCRNCGGLRNGTDSKKGQKPCRCDAPRFDNTQLPRMRAYQEWCERWAAECLRVAKPGAYMLAFGGTRTYHRLACAIEDAGWEIRDSLHWVYGSGFPKGKACLKPAHEPIVLARKPAPRVVPFPGLDACRVAGPAGNGHWVRNGEMGTRGIYGQGGQPGGDFGQENPAGGRWPPNLLLTHHPECNGQCAPGCPVTDLDTQSGTSTSAIRAGGEGEYLDPSREGWRFKRATGGFTDTGGASRFFPVFRYQAKAPARERPRLPDGTAHPTVKPLALMRWLVRLVTPPGGTVLDPFCGTGTTLQAAAVEGVHAIGIDNDPAAAEYVTQRLSQGTLA